MSVLLSPASVGGMSQEGPAPMRGSVPLQQSSAESAVATQSKHSSAEFVLSKRVVPELTQ